MKRFYFCVLFLALGSTQAKLPAVIPWEILFANPARTDPKISPDGSQLSWLAPDENNTLNVWTNALEGGNARCVAHDRRSRGPWKEIAGAPAELK